MAIKEYNQISREELKRILEEHHHWIKSNGEQGKSANLAKANLQATYHRGFFLPRANLSRANLHMAIIQGGNLNGANLHETILEDASLEGTQLRGANLSGANLHGANLVGANLEGADLRDADLSDTMLISANLCHAKIAGVNFKGAHLGGILIDRKTVSLFPQEVVNLHGKSFFILGYTDDLNKIIRSIEFPPEYHQAGISILNYFGSVLRKKYPEQKAKIRLDQEDLKVTMTVEPIEGDPEIIEKALDEYGLVITGNMSLEEYTEDPILMTDLKNQLINAKAQLEMQRNLLVLQGSQVEKKDLQIEQLLSVLGQATQKLGRSSPITVAPNFSISSDISPSLTGRLSQQASIEFAPQISLIQGNLNELKEQLPVGSEGAKSVEQLQQSLEHIEKTNTPEDVAKSSAMSVFRRFLENVDKAETTAGKVIKTTKDGIDIARKLAGNYNDIAQWCGLPQVPEPFVKKREK